MFSIDDELTIHITRGDAASFLVTAKDNDIPYIFKTGEVVRIKVFAKKDCIDVAFQKDFVVESDSEFVEILLTEKETKIGEVISKPVTYWYEIELNPYDYPQTIVGYHEDGVKMFKLYPEGRDLGVTDIEEEDIPIIDTELSLTSERPVQNQAIARAVNKLELNFERLERNTERELDTTKETVMNELNGVKQECKRIDTVLKNYNIETEAEPTVTEISLDSEGASYVTSGGIKVISNGINAIIDINALMWNSASERVWVTVATLPENLAPLENKEVGYMDDELIMFFDDGDKGIKFGFNGNRLRMKVENATWAKQKSINCQLQYALRKTVVNEAADIRRGYDGTEYPTAGEAVRTQVMQVEEQAYQMNQIVLGEIYKNQNSINVCEKKISDCETMVGESTQMASDLARVSTFNSENIQSAFTGEDVRVTLSMAKTGVCINPSCVKTPGEKFEMSFISAESYYLLQMKVSAGDVLKVGTDFLVSSECPYIIVTDRENVVVCAYTFTEFVSTDRGYGGKIRIAESGYVYVSARFTENTKELFLIEKSKNLAPLVLDATLTETYNADSKYGDEALEAILKGRQILVRTPNADGGNYTRIFSPVYMYHIPNYENKYLYLFYLKDEKQTIDLTALGMGQIQMPIYGELKMRLSKKYNECPLKY